MSNLRKKININGSGTEIFTYTNRGYVDCYPTRSTSLGEASDFVTMTTDAATIVNANIDRLNLLLQNQSVVPILLKFGGTASSTAYNIILAAGSDLKIGDGGSYFSESWKGAISGITLTGSGDVSILEQNIST